MTTQYRLLSLCSLAVIAILVGCNGGGGGGGGGSIAEVAAPAPRVQDEFESNDTFDLANLLEPEIAGLGDLDAGTDVDFWSFAGTEGDVVCIEVQALILDQARWTDMNNDVMLEVYGPDRALIARHDDSLFPGRDIDLDIPLLMIDQTGTHYIRVANRTTTREGGAYSIRCRHIRLEGEQFEAEAYATSGSNDSVATAQPIEPGTLWGYHVDNEYDFYSFEVTEPSTVRIDIKAIRGGILAGESRYYDPLIRFYNEAGTQLTANDDSVYYDSGLWLYVAEPGNYSFAVHEYSGNSADGEYFVTLEVDRAARRAVTLNETPETAFQVQYRDFVAEELPPQVVQHYKLWATAGDMVRLYTYQGGNHTASAGGVGFDILGPDGVSLAADTGLFARRVLVRATGFQQITVTNSSSTPRSYAFRTEYVRRSTFEQQPNDTVAQARTIGMGPGYSGAIESDGDIDLYRVTAAADRVLSLTIHAENVSDFGLRQMNGFGSALRPMVRILDADGNELTRGFHSTSRGAQRPSNAFATVEVAFVPVEPGAYFVEVSSLSGFGSNHTYLIEQTR